MRKDGNRLKVCFLFSIPLFRLKMNSRILRGKRHIPYPTSFNLLFSKFIIPQLVWYTFAYTMAQCHLQFSPKKAQEFQVEQGGIATMLMLVPISEVPATHYLTSVHKLFNSVSQRKCHDFLLQNPCILPINDKLSLYSKLGGIKVKRKSRVVSVQVMEGYRVVEI